MIGKVEKYLSSLDTQDERIKVFLIIDELKGNNQNKMTLIKAYEKHVAMRRINRS